MHLIIFTIKIDIHLAKLVIYIYLVTNIANITEMNCWRSLQTQSVQLVVGGK